jgi:membrane dipeptidase
MRQAERYAAWEKQGLLKIVRKGNEFSAAAGPLQLMILMEGAAGVRTVADLPGFFAAGVRVLSLCWAAGTRYAGGNGSGEDVSKAGREMIGELDKLGVVHDVSHLSEKAFWTLMKVAKGPKIASHSNCRALLPKARSPERHLTDEQIRAVTDAGGMIGVVLFNHFLVDKGRATIADVLRHIAHIEKIAGRRDCIGLGSDMDGGFSAEGLPTDLDHPRKFTALAEALRQAGWSETEIGGFMYGNWAAFFRRTIA